MKPSVLIITCNINRQSSEEQRNRQTPKQVQRRQGELSVDFLFAVIFSITFRFKLCCYMQDRVEFRIRKFFLIFRCERQLITESLIGAKPNWQKLSTSPNWTMHKTKRLLKDKNSTQTIFSVHYGQKLRHLSVSFGLKNAEFFWRNSSPAKKTSCEAAKRLFIWQVSIVSSRRGFELPDAVNNNTIDPKTENTYSSWHPRPCLKRKQKHLRGFNFIIVQSCCLQAVNTSSDGWPSRTVGAPSIVCGFEICERVYLHAIEASVFWSSRETDQN